MNFKKRTKSLTYLTIWIPVDFQKVKDSDFQNQEFISGIQTILTKDVRFSHF
jgi:hypothetical protein